MGLMEEMAAAILKLYLRFRITKKEEKCIVILDGFQGSRTKDWMAYHFIGNVQKSLLICTLTTNKRILRDIKFHTHLFISQILRAPT